MGGWVHGLPNRFTWGLLFGEIEIRELDQMVSGNPAHHLIRLALSMASAIRGSDVPGVTAAFVVEQMVACYEKGLLG